MDFIDNDAHSQFFPPQNYYTVCQSIGWGLIAQSEIKIHDGYNISPKIKDPNDVAIAFWTECQFG
jgi:hypothetical protein